MINPRIYYDGELTIDTTLSLPKGSSHHLCQVLRLREGSALTLFNGNGLDYSATIEACGKTANVTVLSNVDNPTESKLEIHLVQGLSRGDRMDLTIQKAVELGVTSITPLLTQKTSVKLAPDRRLKKQQHWHNIIVGACEQSHRSVIPALHEPIKFRDWLNTIDRDDSIANILLAPESKQSFKQLPSSTNQCRILIGPESGFTRGEIDACIDHKFYAISMGPRVMRTETAGAAAIAVLQSQFGDFG